MSTQHSAGFFVMMWAMTLLCVAYVIIRFVFLFLPFSFWVEYYSVVPAKPVFEVGEKLRFVSDSEIRREVSILYNDVIFCKLGEDTEGQDIYEKYSEQNTRRTPAVERPRMRVPWPYLPPVDYETECYAEHNIELKPRMSDFTKHKKIVGPHFLIKSSP